MKIKKNKLDLEPSSFRDPSGHIFYDGDKVLRVVNKIYQSHLQKLFESGLYESLVNKNLLLAHRKEANSTFAVGGAEVFSTTRLPFISYPYEWSFSQLKDAALLTLNIQKIALEHEMVLKDASCYNVQFQNGKPIFIDLLSFEKYEQNEPWVAYRQFCQHFLGPLLLTSKVDVRLNQLLKIHLDGIPLDLISKLLPKASYLNLGIVSHIHLHAQNQERLSKVDTDGTRPKYALNKLVLLGIVDNLTKLIENLKMKNQQTEWEDYYEFTNYTDEAFEQKKAIVERFLKRTSANYVWDVGANNGEFSRISSEQGIFTVSSDIDPLAVEKNYLKIKKNNDQNLLPLVIDLTNPSPAIGWENNERRSFINRGPADMVLALALIHHLAISNNLPFSRIANFFQMIGKHLIIEFVPKSDSQVQKLLKTREDIFNQYNQQFFESEFSTYFDILDRMKIKGSDRIVYLMKAK